MNKILSKNIKSQEKFQTMLVNTHVDPNISKIQMQPMAVLWSDMSLSKAVCFNFEMDNKNVTTDVSSDINTDTSCLQNYT